MPVFVSSGRPRLYCYECQPKPAAAPRKPYTPRVPVSARCANQECVKDFVAMFERQRFCCAGCRTAVNNIEAQKRRRDRSVRNCGHCGLGFAPAYGEHRQKYCCAQCATKQAYKRSTGSTHRRRAKKHGGRFDGFDKREVFERDGWCCKLCGMSTPASKQGLRHHDSPELDHIVALAAGGDHSMENTQCLCRSCNGLKGTRSMAQLVDWLGK